MLLYGAVPLFCVSFVVGDWAGGLCSILYLVLWLWCLFLDSYVVVLLGGVQAFVDVARFVC